MGEAAICVGRLLARGRFLSADTGRRLEMSASRRAAMFDSEMVGIFAAVFVFWVAVAGLVYIIA